MAKRLNQIIAAEAHIKASTTAKITALHRASTKNRDIFEGVLRTYTPLDENGEHMEDEAKRVQLNVRDQVDEARSAWEDHLDVTLTKDIGNQGAVASVEIGGSKLLTDVPVTYLLFLEKRLHDIAKFASSLPVLDDAHEWTPDVTAGVYRSNPEKTHRTQKVQVPIVLHPPTDKHPAQTQLITKDVVVGHYEKTLSSGAIPERTRRQWVRRVEVLLVAVKEAREKANGLSIVDQGGASASILGYIFE